MGNRGEPDALSVWQLPSQKVLRREMLFCSVDKVVGSFLRCDDIETAELTLQED